MMGLDLYGSYDPTLPDTAPTPYSSLPVPNGPFPAAPSMGGLGGFGGFVQSDNFGNVMQALGASLLSSPRNAPLSGFAPALASFQGASQDRRKEAHAQQQAEQERMAMEQALISFNIPPDEARNLSVNPQAAKLRLDQMQQQAANAEKQKEANATIGFLKRRMPNISDEDAAYIAANPSIMNDFLKPQAANDYQERAAAAAQFGLDPGSPAYQSYILTGKMPREDQAPLTATDKKAILEADDMVAANENAIQALDQAAALSDKANSGWLAGTRAAIGNNLPDLVVPDRISSPESSAATTDMDNAIVGQALTSLKAIFGGNPTEGERKILLDLQGSSSMPANVRKQIIERAKALAQRRLEFNRQRAAELRGGDYYKPGGGGKTQQPAPAGVSNTTSTGIQWSTEP